MHDFLLILGWFITGAATAAAFASYMRHRRSQQPTGGAVAPAELTRDVIAAHFAPASTGELTIAERQFPERVRADLQRAVDAKFTGKIELVRFSSVRSNYEYDGLGLTDCLSANHHSPPEIASPSYLEVDIGEEAPIRCLKSGLWLLRNEGQPFVVLFGNATMGRGGVRFQIATLPTPEGKKLADDFYAWLEQSVARAESYRGKILSLEQSEHSYGGTAAGIKVHKLRHVERDQVILPSATIDQLDRNVIRFVQQRKQLGRYRLSTKKGLLFYGPPGTGKTHTIHYLARALPGHTTLLMTAEQIGLISEYMTLARLLQPSIVVIEDVDLIGGDRASSSVCEQVVLNKLLNEMDGLTEDADILFLLTTNRPEALEAALAARPGRVDQAIEFPLPDAVGREKLVRLYAQHLTLDPEIIASIVRRTANVSAAFIKELMRRILQFHLERGDDGPITAPDVDLALEEMLFRGGPLNLKLLGADQAGQVG
ncbi:MAG TPA: AAA family ATPase [Pirellulaceae bacterium]|nr:AAA family ATPase [Pirellulaceae bacterium]